MQNVSFLFVLSNGIPACILRDGKVRFAGSVQSGFGFEKQFSIWVQPPVLGKIISLNMLLITCSNPTAPD